MNKQTNNINTTLQELYTTCLDGLNSASGSFINSLRADGLSRFALWGLPLTKDEDYKYSDINKWFTSTLTSKYTPRVEAQKLYLKQYTNGIVVCDINTFAREYKDIFESYYTKSVEDDSLMMLSRAFSGSGMVIYVPRNVLGEEFIHLTNNDEEGSLTLGERNLFIFERGSLAKIHISHHRQGIKNSVTEIFLADGANVELSEDYSSTPDSLNIHTISTSVARNAFYKHISINLSDGLSRTNEYVSLLGSGSEASIYGGVMARNSSHIDNFTLIKHQVANCRSFEQFKCVASGTSTSAFNGNIYVAAGAGQTEAYQQNNNILLSDNANVYSKPNLEIYADDVKCSHGATVGQLDNDALFYMQQRGITLPEAKNLMIKGFLMDIVSKISSSDIVEQLREKIENV